MRRICLSLILVASVFILSAQGWEMDNFYFNPSGIPSMPFAQILFNDIDNDEDYDIWLGNSTRPPIFLENNGSATNPSYTLGYDYLEMMLIDYSDMAVSVDLDGDGILDLVTGGPYGVYFWKCIDPDTGTYTLQSGMFEDVVTGYYPIPDLADIDGDGDLDVLSGTQMGNIKYFRNEGSIYHPIWQEDNSFFSVINQTVFSSVTAGEINGDGLPDVIIGDLSGNIYLYRNLGTSLQLSPFFFTGLNFGPWSCPRLVDMDMDGDLDLVVGGVNGTLAYLENTGDALSPNWILVNGFFDGINVGYHASPSFADLDEDGDLGW